MTLPEKLKCSIFICCFDRSKKSKIELYFAKDYFSIHFIEPLKDEDMKQIKEIFSPFFSKNNLIIKISYIYIKSIYADNSRLLKFTLHNPISTSTITIIFNHFKYKKSLIFSDANLPSSMLPSIALDINKKIISLIEKKIRDFITIIHLLYQFTSNERKYDQLIENLFMNAFNFGKVYYDKCVKELLMSEKRNRKLMNEETAKKINKFINEMKTEIESNNKNNKMEQIQGAIKNSSSIEDEDEEKSKTKNMEIIDKILIDNNNDSEYSEFKPSMLLALNIDSNYKKDLFQYYDKFKKFIPDIKMKTSYFSEITINLIFKIFNVDRKDLDNKYNIINKSAIGLRIDINLNKLRTSINDDSKTNYNFKTNINDINVNDDYKLKKSFENINNTMKTYYNDENSSNQNEKFLNELLDFSKKFHSFAPNNSIENITDNTSQIIHRKFFELLFKHFFSDIIDIESDKNKAIGSETFHLILKVLRRLKKIIFTNKNVNYYNEFLFLLEQ